MKMEIAPAPAPVIAPPTVQMDAVKLERRLFSEQSPFILKKKLHTTQA